jgi:hypothetical protein
MRHTSDPLRLAITQPQRRSADTQPHPRTESNAPQEQYASLVLSSMDNTGLPKWTYY